MQSSPNRSESALAVRGRDDQRRLGRRGRGAAAREHAGAVARGDRGRPVEASGADPGEQIAVAAAPAVPELGEDPARCAEVVLIVLDGLVLEMHAEVAEQVVEVVAVLLVLGLTAHDQSAAAADERVDRIELIACQQWRADPRRFLPPRVRRMSDHEHVAAAQRVLGQRPVRVRGDLEVAFGQCRRGQRVGRVGRMRRLHLAG